MLIIDKKQVTKDKVGCGAVELPFLGLPEALPDNLGQGIGDAAGEGIVQAFNHDAADGLGAGVAHEDPSAAGQFRFGLLDRVLQGRQIFQRRLGLDRDIDQDLGRQAQDAGQLG